MIERIWKGKVVGGHNDVWAVMANHSRKIGHVHRRLKGQYHAMSCAYMATGGEPELVFNTFSSRQAAYQWIEERVK